MFISLIRRNGKKNRRENSIYFLSLAITIVAFYIILSLEDQDVMAFLRRMESDAVNRLLGLISGVYGFSLFILFFLIYFAEKYQFERRSREFGMLLMLGMKRSRLFLWLMAEDFYSSGMALAIGLPTAVFLSEVISLITARLIGLGIIGHHFALSARGISLTVLGFLGIKLMANILLSTRLIRREPYRLLNETQEEKLKSVSRKRSFATLILGFLLLAIAYGMAIGNLTWMHLVFFTATLALGFAGTWLTIRGFCAIFSRFTRNRRTADRLHMFTFRQLEENVFLRSGSLTVSSVLVLIAIACMSYGVSVASANLESGQRHTMDFTLESYDEPSGQAIEDLIRQSQSEDLIDRWSSVSVAYLPTEGMWSSDGDRKTCTYDTSGLQEAASHLSAEQQKRIQNNDIFRDSPHIIALSGINEILENQGKPPLSLTDNELYIYVDPTFYDTLAKETYDRLLPYGPRLTIDGKEYLLKGICSEDIVVDRSITIMFGLILPDEIFRQYAGEDYFTYWNAYLSPGLIRQKGLMQAITTADEWFSASGLPYENYLQNMGRQLFYIVAASYLMIYLALIFLVIANTVISLQYLMQEEKTRRRYHTLVCLGSDSEDICASSRRQIRWYFGLPLATAAVSGIFATISLFSGLLSPTMQSQGSTLFFIAGAVLIVLCVIEWGYMKMVMRLSRENILRMMEIRRSE